MQRIILLVFVVLFCLCFYSCGEGRKSPTGDETLYKNVYLIDRFERKNASGDEKSVKVMSISINGDSRRSLFEHPRSGDDDTKEREVVFPGIELGGDAALKFGIGVREEAYTAVVEGRNLGGIIYRIFVDDGTGRNPVFEQELRPFERKEDRGWHDCSVDLSGYEGKTVDIILSTSYAEGERVWGHAFWSDPILVMSYTRKPDNKNMVLMSNLLGGSGPNVYLLDLFKGEVAPEDDNGAGVVTVSIQGNSRRCLFLHPRSRGKEDRESAIRNIKIGGDAALKFGIGIKEAAYDAVVGGKHLGGIIFRIYIEKGGKKKLAFEKTLRPFERKEDRGWHDFTLDLSRYANETVDIVFVTRYAQGDQIWGHAVWSNPFLENIPTENFPPNIILISIDTLRADHLGCYGYNRDTSPNIDEFARDSVLYTYSFCHSHNTLESHSSILTALEPINHLSFKKRLGDKYVTLAEILSKLNYYTVCFNGGGYLLKRFGLNQGFDEYYSFLGTTAYNDIVWEFSETAKFLKDRLGKDQEKRLFLFFHTYEVHSPYNPPEEFKRLFIESDDGPTDGIPDDVIGGDISTYVARYRKEHGNTDFPEKERKLFLDLYDAEIRYTDTWMGRLFDFLKEEGLYDDSLIILLSDHGEQFYEHGEWLHHTVYGHDSYVPLIIKYPHSAKKGVEKERIARSVDVMPTILQDFLNIDITDAHFDGIPLSRSLDGAVTVGTTMVHSRKAGDEDVASMSVLKGKYKFIYFFPTDKIEVYEFKKDMLNLKKITVDESITEEFSRVVSDKYKLFQKNMKIRSGAGEKDDELDEKTKKNLRDLGYLQ